MLASPPRGSMVHRLATAIGIGSLVFSGTVVSTLPASAKSKYTIDPVTGTKYKADDDMKDLLAAFASLGGKPIETLTPAEARVQPTMADAVNVVLMERGLETDPTRLIPDITTADASIPGTTLDTPLSATIYTPVGNGPFPAVVYFHGGGWVIGSKAVYDASARAIAKGANAVVISVDYRLAPEHKFPAAWDDALAAYKWASTHVATWRGDPRRLALAGESAGGNLALATAIAAVDAGLPRPKAVIAIYPVTQTGTETESYVDSAHAKVLNKPMITWFLGQTFRSPADKTDSRVDIIHSKLSLLPPVTIVNAQIDPLRSDGAMLEEALKQLGIPVMRKEYEGVSMNSSVPPRYCRLPRKLSRSLPTSSKMLSKSDTRDAPVISRS